MGKKYIIELCEKPMKNENGNDIWRVKGFNTLVFDQNGLDKLEEYKEPVSHKFEVGDVCYPIGGDPNVTFIITRITPQLVSYMWADGAHSFLKTSLFEHQAKFVRHSNYFETFLEGGLK